MEPYPDDRSRTYATWPLEALEDALRDAEHLLYLLGALHQKKLDFDADAIRLRKVPEDDRHLLQLELTGRSTAIRTELHQRLVI